MILRIVSYAAVFYLGRLSYILWKNSVLENKAAKLEDVIAKLTIYAENLKSRETVLRENYRNMLDMIGEYKTEVTGGPVSWDRYDDLLLSHWERTEE